MLKRAITPSLGRDLKRAQQGIVLIVALIMLVALTIAGVVLVRSTDISNIIAGNLAFKQGATHAGDIAVERAVAWLQTNSGAFLYDPRTANGYRPDGNNPLRSPAAGQSWDAYWATLAANTIWVLPDTDTDFANTGNRVSLIIDRMCANTGNPNSGANCTASTVASVAGQSGEEGGEISIKAPSAVYYRVTARIAGPRNTVSYVQAMVTL